jgi:hypothetical protein
MDDVINVGKVLVVPNLGSKNALLVMNVALMRR